MKSSYIRLLPIIIFVSFMLLGTRIVEFSRYFGVSSLSAAQAKSEEKGKEEKTKTEESNSKDKDSSHGSHDKKKESKGESEGQKGISTERPEEAAPAKMTSEGRKSLTQFSTTEVEILQRLGERRKELEERAKQLDLKEGILNTTQANMERKLEEMKILKTELEQLLAQYGERENTKLKSLAKIYETMKPKDAARIFNTLDMEILLPVIDKMKEAKTAPILAQMNPEKAQDVTIELANQRKLKQAKKL